MHRKNYLPVVLCLAVILWDILFSRPVLAEETRTLAISSREEFLQFAEDCRLDSYSLGLTVTLEQNIDLEGISFKGIPTFGGTLEGKGHTISGLQIEEVGSYRGLFRYVQKDAVIRGLRVKGEVSPSGSRSVVGGLVGSNEGLIENCVFYGEVSGADYVGGIAGRNEVTGILENCRVEGEINGNHFVGGMAGENVGVIRDCTNKAQINTTVQQNQVELSDITIGTLTGTEAVNTVTDMGGIAGISSGVIRDCRNRGAVGYQHMGYNIGGIVGNQTGLVVDCKNDGRILGRKEVGGIVGQLEPSATLKYEEDTLQILDVQLATMDKLVDKTSSGIQSSSNKLSSQASVLQKQMQDAQAAIDVLLPDQEGEELPDRDSAIAAGNSLNTSLSQMGNTLQGMGDTTQSGSNQLNKNLQELQNQMEAIRGTLQNPETNLGGSVQDISDADTEEDTTSKVVDCVNRGDVQADANVGGIVGAIALENDLDPEEDVEISGELSLYFESELRAVILRCENQGELEVKHQNAGGIVGWMSMGLARFCENIGRVTGAGADYVGGVAGNSAGYIRGSSARCFLTGVDYVGGIAGTASVVTDCRSMVQLEGKERTGAVVGYVNMQSEPREEETVAGNYYLAVGQDPGAIDGISYDLCAQPLGRKEFLELEGLPDSFQKVTVRFYSEGKPLKTLRLALGDSLSEKDIPKVPEKEGYVGTWAGLETADLEHMEFDLEFTAAYTAHSTVIQSKSSDAKGRPLLLAQGAFMAGEQVVLEPIEDFPLVDRTQSVLESWKMKMPDRDNQVRLRYLVPENCKAGELLIMVRQPTGNWRTVEFTLDGSYAVFDVEPGENMFCLVESPTYYVLPVLLGVGGLLILLLLVALFRRKKQ